MNRIEPCISAPRLRRCNRHLIPKPLGDRVGQGRVAVLEQKLVQRKEPTVAELRVFGWIRPIVFAHKAAEVLLNLAPINEPLAMVIAWPVSPMRLARGKAIHRSR